MELSNNAYFWQKLDTLYLSGDIVIDKPKGSTHPKYSNLVYPVNYGYLKADDMEVIKVYKGSRSVMQVDAITVCVDILAKDIDIKLLIGCTEEEENTILGFLNQTDFQKTIIVRRGTEIPDWATSN